jgi:hypothetical protein
MSQIHVTARLLSVALATLAASAAPQQPSPGSTTIRTEQELKISLEPAALPSKQCEAVASIGYYQRNTLARVESKIEVTGCTAAAGEFRIGLRIRDDSGEIKALEFNETWQRSADAEVIVTTDYPIGENVELVSARVRGLTCTCADAAAVPAHD